MMYSKVRRDFGRQPLFSFVPAHFLDSIEPNPILQTQYCLRNPVNRESQACVPMSKNYINTLRVDYVPRGVEHAEGGWPKDVNIYDEETTARYRRRIERDDEYVSAVLTLCPKLEHLVKQNNAIDLYQHYFEGLPQQEPIEKPNVNLCNEYKDPFNEKSSRPVACIDWTLEDHPKIAVAYCDKRYPVHQSYNSDLTCCIWDLKEAVAPLHSFLPPSPCWQIVCSPTSPTVLIGGLADGRVCIFDVREDKSAVNVSQMHLAHRDPVTSLIFLQSRLNTDFFSASTDGQCLWYDIRNLSEPTDSLIMDIAPPHGQKPNMANAEPISVLQYERLFPTKFFCGTDTGLAINVNRKGKTHNEKINGVYNAHGGPVRALHRSPNISKMFITCGDWTVHIWSEDIKSSPIITGMAQRNQIQDVIWAPHKVSGYMHVGDDGKFYYWDILQNLRKPLVVLPLTKRRLLKMKANVKGNLISIGDETGTLYLLSLSHNLIVSGDKDKQVTVEKYERETRREHILETRIKEIKLKLKGGMDQGTDMPEIVHDVEAEVRLAEDEYRRIVIEEIRRTGMTVQDIKKRTK